jgi:hypothetical protein
LSIIVSTRSTEILIVDVAVDSSLCSVPLNVDDAIRLAANALRFDRSRCSSPPLAGKACGIIQISSCCTPRRVDGETDDRLVLHLLAADRLLTAAARRILRLHAARDPCREAGVWKLICRVVGLVGEARPRRRGL